MRIKQKTKKAVIVTSSACPAFIGRILMPNALSVLKAAANCIGAKVVKKFYFGLVAAEKNAGLNPKGIEKARRAGMKLFDN
ncbi:MAG: hypothetical protein ACYTBV_04310 [Planctomycetota bacterium]|jgi:hypothetical protein